MGAKHLLIGWKGPVVDREDDGGALSFLPMNGGRIDVFWKMRGDDPFGVVDDAVFVGWGGHAVVFTVRSLYKTRFSFRLLPPTTRALRNCVGLLHTTCI